MGKLEKQQEAFDLEIPSEDDFSSECMVKPCQSRRNIGRNHIRVITPRNWDTILWSKPRDSRVADCGLVLDRVFCAPFMNAPLIKTFFSTKKLPGSLAFARAELDS